MKSLAGLPINWRAARFLAIGYVSLSAFNVVFGLPLVVVSVGLLWLLVFLSGPAGILLGLLTMPGWAMATIALYCGGACLFAPFLILSCHRDARVSALSCVVAVFLWPFAGFVSVAWVFAFA